MKTRATLKQCKYCTIWKPETEQFFNPKDSFKSGFNSRCRLCVNELATVRRRRLGYPEQKTGKIFCPKCEKKRPAKEFRKNKQKLNGKTTYCNQCYGQNYGNRIYVNKKRKVYNPNEVPYRKTHPEKWNEYQNEYHKQYRKNPVSAKRMDLSAAITRAIQKGHITKPDCCNDCKAEKKVTAFFSLNQVKSYFAKKINIEFLNPIWICHKCRVRRGRFEKE